ncbi:hypothetical protein AURANDRAFT_62716 [Aureococcus anophagefferens]|uniref:Uncharacterized protein n=1 Tax=Aureococcus anophagefferens TaxID=44056 RepID=F0Y4L1_AURAN|nr:hypothetical protein AURANDRAFT_62716 [Aureococcus anophagefferens]EGB10372.1 hypothetical protein AURANDRAFT_62716 [Aureococcus anophagefferens]|eukprot:XP_009035175.1 hypothetical protein AURANDRAFT_62716 [Aureococcus anophagefferens]
MSTPASPEPSGAPPFAYDGGEPFTPTSFASPQPEDFDIDAMDAQEQAYQREQQEIQAAIAAAAEQQQEISKKQVIASFRLLFTRRAAKARDVCQGFRAFKFGWLLDRTERAAARSARLINEAFLRRERGRAFLRLKRATALVGALRRLLHRKARLAARLAVRRWVWFAVARHGRRGLARRCARRYGLRALRRVWGSRLLPWFRCRLRMGLAKLGSERDRRAAGRRRRAAGADRRKARLLKWGLGSLTHSARKLAADRAARERADALARAAESADVRDLATHDRVAAERARLGAVLDVVAAAGEAAAARGAAAAAAAEAAAAAARGAVGAVDAAEARDAAEAADERRRDSERDAAARRLRCDEAEASAERADEARADAERARDDAADEAFWSDDATKAADASIKAATFLRHRGNLRRAAVAACARAYHATALAAALARRALLHWRCQADARRAKAIVAVRLLGRCRLRSRAAHRAFARWRTWTEFAAKRQVFPA